MASPLRIAALSGVLVLSSPLAANAQSADPSPTPSARPGSISVGIQAHATFISEATHGPGVTPPEGPAFAAGSPLSPLTPYDTFSSAPLTPGNAVESSLVITPAYFGKRLQAALTLGVGYVRGSTTVGSYWGESLFPTLNPHLGSPLLPYRVTFPTHAGSDDGTGFVASILSGSLRTRDGNLTLRGGYFDLTQTDGFVFTQPALTSIPPAIAFATAESLGNGIPTLDWWGTSSPVLPLHGIDGVFKRDLGTLELTSAALPSLPGTGARLNMASFVIDHGEGTRYSLQALHVATSGALVTTSVLYGRDSVLLPSPQGMLPSSTIGGQRQTIIGARAAFHLVPTLDGALEYGHSNYDADQVAQPGTSKPGNYYHAGMTRTVRRLALGLDVYRNEAYYAQTLIPYGVPENVWSVAWSWPGQWLKSNYQLINDFPVNINRQGYRLRYALSGGALEVKAIYANFGQIEPVSLSNAYRTGFVDGFFLQQADAAATLGRQHQYALWGAWHPSFGDLTIDYTEDTMRRPALAAYPADTVSYDAPSYVLTFSHGFGKNVLASAGYGRYAMRGSFAQAFTNVDFVQRIGIFGAQIQQTKNTAMLVSIRWSGLNGLPSIPFVGPPPAFSGTVFIFEQKLKVQ